LSLSVIKTSLPAGLFFVTSLYKALILCVGRVERKEGAEKQMSRAERVVENFELHWRKRGI